MDLWTDSQNETDLQQRKQNYQGLESNGNICEVDIEEIKKKIIIAVVQ